MYGVVKDVYLCNLDRTLELSQRIAARNVPSAPMQASFGIRPVSTKYALMPVLDRRAPASVQVQKEPTFSTATMFNPGDGPGPWSGFATNIDLESGLRRQFFALQKCEQSEYVPSTKSDMYTVQVEGRKEAQPFPYLFEQSVFTPRGYTGVAGKDLFENHTRQQRMSGNCINNKLGK